MPLFYYILNLRNQLLFVRHIQHIPGRKDVIGQTTKSVLGRNAVFFRTEDNADRRIVVRIVHFACRIAQIHIDLPRCFQSKLCVFWFNIYLNALHPELIKNDVGTLLFAVVFYLFWDYAKEIVFKQVPAIFVGKISFIQIC